MQNERTYVRTNDNPHNYNSVRPQPSQSSTAPHPQPPSYARPRIDWERQAKINAHGAAAARAALHHATRSEQ